MAKVHKHNVNVEQTPPQSIYGSVTGNPTSQGPFGEDQSRTELRFSFAQPTADEHSSSLKTTRRNVFAEQSAKNKRPDSSLNNTFSNLSFDGTSAVEAPASLSRTPVSVHSAPPVLPELTKPTRNREGYGFSYTDTVFQDSFEYPDTECDWGSETERDSPNGHDSGFEDTPATVTGSATLTAIESNTSFDDVVVVRDVGSFYMARPQKVLSCTTATREDTIRVKHAAKRLLKYEESPTIYAELVRRLERMVHASLDSSKGGAYMTTATSATACALKLQDFLLRSKSGRIETGEVGLLVEHEIEWATWLVEASRTGVMHLKVKGCKCRPDWEDE
ncbi:hypothetical protein DE146DRAFT_185017 [Phaeosphaeria sp. MPI-PUGE-AT-0046c]|nr:hypothetical protein DE146DRAFT_185017 [Phaeosphaeria sp. MPI-PUGE-AT-0046c]